MAQPAERRRKPSRLARRSRAMRNSLLKTLPARSLPESHPERHAGRWGRHAACHKNGAALVRQTLGGMKKHGPLDRCRDSLPEVACLNHAPERPQGSGRACWQDWERLLEKSGTSVAGKHLCGGTEQYRTVPGRASEKSHRKQRISPVRAAKHRQRRLPMYAKSLVAHAFVICKKESRHAEPALPERCFFV